MGSVRRLWFRLPPKSRVLFALAATLVSIGAGLLGEELYFRANAVRVEGVVVAHDRKGRPIVDYQWGGQSYRHETRGPSGRLAVGTGVGIYIRRTVPRRPGSTTRSRSCSRRAGCA